MSQRVVLTRKIPNAGIDLLRQAGVDVDIWPGSLPPTRSELLELVVGAAGIGSLLSDKIDAEVMATAGPQLKVVANYAVGFNNIDTKAAAARSVQVGNTPDVLTDATSDVAILLMLGAARCLKPAMQDVAAFQWNTWEPLGYLGLDLAEKTLGVVGFGRIGQQVARRIHFGWGMQVLYTARSPKPEAASITNASYVPMQQLLNESDFVSIHCDLNPSTANLFSRAAFSQMKQTAVLVNTSRGGVVDQEALDDALGNGGIFAAGLDVTEPEPIASDSPLRNRDNCLILPHIGSATQTARSEMSMMLAQNLIEGMSDRPLPYPAC